MYQRKLTQAWSVRLQTHVKTDAEFTVRTKEEAFFFHEDDAHNHRRSWRHLYCCSCQMLWNTLILVLLHSCHLCPSSESACRSSSLSSEPEYFKSPFHITWNFKFNVLQLYKQLSWLFLIVQKLALPPSRRVRSKHRSWNIHVPPPPAVLCLKTAGQPLVMMMRVENRAKKQTVSNCLMNHNFFWKTCFKIYRKKDWF